MELYIISTALLSSIMILFVRSMLIKVNKNEKRFLYLELKGKKNDIEKYKLIYNSKINRLSLSFIAAYTVSIVINNYSAIIVNGLFFVTYFIYVGLINNMSINHVVKNYGSSIKKIKKYKFGGIFNKDTYL